MTIATSSLTPRRSGWYLAIHADGTLSIPILIAKQNGALTAFPFGDPVAYPISDFEFLTGPKRHPGDLKDPRRAGR